MFFPLPGGRIDQSCAYHTVVTRGYRRDSWRRAICVAIEASAATTTTTDVTMIDRRRRESSASKTRRLHTCHCMRSPSRRIRASLRWSCRVSFMNRVEASRCCLRQSFAGTCAHIRALPSKKSIRVVYVVVPALLSVPCRVVFSPTLRIQHATQKIDGSRNFRQHQ